MTPMPKKPIFLPMALVTIISLLVSPEQIQGAQDSLHYTLPSGNSARDKYVRDLACYIFDGISGVHDPACRTTLRGTLDTSQIPGNATESLDNALKPLQSDSGVGALRSWWNKWFLPLGSLRGQDALIPTSLEDFERLHQYKNWHRDIIVKSRVKSKTRVIYRSPVGHQTISVSETRDSTTGDLDSKIIETEVVIERLDNSGNFDFYAYNADGQLSTTAWFPSGEKTLPGICLSCHHSPTTGTFKRTGR
jgi:hypothetical protein